MKYDIPNNWQETCDGQGCACGAYGQCECGCACDWTPREVYELRAEVNKLTEENALLQKGIDDVIEERDGFIDECDGYRKELSGI